jgi:hypothetical protein
LDTFGLVLSAEFLINTTFGIITYGWIEMALSPKGETPLLIFRAISGYLGNYSFVRNPQSVVKFPMPDIS